MCFPASHCADHAYSPSINTCCLRSIPPLTLGSEGLPATLCQTSIGDCSDVPLRLPWPSSACVKVSISVIELRRAELFKRLPPQRQKIPDTSVPLYTIAFKAVCLGGIRTAAAHIDQVGMKRWNPTVIKVAELRQEQGVINMSQSGGLNVAQREQLQHLN